MRSISCLVMCFVTPEEEFIARMLEDEGDEEGLFCNFVMHNLFVPNYVQYKLYLFPVFTTEINCFIDLTLKGTRSLVVFSILIVSFPSEWLQTYSVYINWI